MSWGCYACIASRLQLFLSRGFFVWPLNGIILMFGQVCLLSDFIIINYPADPASHCSQFINEGKIDTWLPHQPTHALGPQIIYSAGST
jgi:hypothetical protein